MSPVSCDVSSSVTPLALGLGPQQLADRRLGRHVEADRRLVEKQQARRVQQARRDLAAHPLAERQLPHRRVEERAELEQRTSAPRSAAGAARAIDLVDAAEQLERVARRQLIPELRALAEHGADLERELRGAAATARSPSTRTSPASGCRMPASIFSVVDLPAPLGPMNATRSPGAIENDSSSTAAHRLAFCG